MDSANAHVPAPGEASPTPEHASSRVGPDAAGHTGPDAGKPGLPFDPRRLIGALARRWPLVLCGGVVCGALGFLAGMAKVQAQYTASANLMRQESAGVIRASDVGEPFKPRQLSAATLVSLAKSSAVLQRVSDQTSPKLGARAILAGLTIAPERSTDIIHMTFRSSRSQQSAVWILNLIGAEVVRLTRDMQAQEATEVNGFLKGELLKTDSDLRDVKLQMLAFSKESGLIDVDKEIDAELRSLGDLDLRYESTRIELETLDLRIRALEKEVAQHNPVSERLQAERDRLAELRQSYTAANPLVAEQQERIAALEQQSKSATGEASVPRGGESGLAAGFYKDLLMLRTQKEVLAAQLAKLKAVREAVNAKLRGLPEKGMEYARIRVRQQSLETARAMLASRQREAQLYLDNPPGYYRFFEAKPDDVETSGRRRKWVLAALAGGVLGILLGLAAVCGREALDDRIKTAADARRVTRLPLLAALPDLEGLDEDARNHWATRVWPVLRAKLAATAGNGVVCGFIASAPGEGCSTWVHLLAEAARVRGARVLALVDRVPDGVTPVPLDQALAAAAALGRAGETTWLVPPAGWRWDAGPYRQWQAALARWQGGDATVVLVELPSADRPEALVLAETLPQVLWLAGSGDARGRTVAEHLATYRAAGCRIPGVLLNREPRRFFGA